jgi:hypothetical protein
MIAPQPAESLCVATTFFDPDKELNNGALRLHMLHGTLRREDRL